MTLGLDRGNVDGEGLFIEALRNELNENSIHVEIMGIKAYEIEKALITVKNTWYENNRFNAFHITEYAGISRHGTTCIHNRMFH